MAISNKSNNASKYQAQNFVNECYNILLKREPDPIGFINHVNHLLEFNNYRVVLNSILRSQEFLNIQNCGENEIGNIKLANTQYGSMLVYFEDQVIGKSLLKNGAFEESKISEVVRYLMQNYHFAPHTFVDIGANIGTHLIYSIKSELFKEAIGIEADGRNFSLLMFNTILNDIERHCSLINIALSDKDGTAILELSPNNFGDHRIRNEHSKTPLFFNEQNRKTKSVKTQTLDSVLKDTVSNWERTLLWIDVQGHEGSIFSGSTDLLSNSNKPYIVTEFWPYGIHLSSRKNDFFEYGKRSHSLF